MCVRRHAAAGARAGAPGGTSSGSRSRGLDRLELCLGAKTCKLKTCKLKTSVTHCIASAGSNNVFSVAASCCSRSAAKMHQCSAISATFFAPRDEPAIWTREGNARTQTSNCIYRLLGEIARTHARQGRL